MFGRKKTENKVDESDAEEAVIPVYFGGQQIGEVIRIKGKEIGGLEHLEIWIQLAFGAGIDKHIKDVVMTQGIYLGSPDASQ